MDDSITKDSSYYRRCSAKRGFGPRKRELVDELRSEENLLTHYIIMTAAVKYPDTEYYKRGMKARQDTEAKMAELKAELDQICGPFKPRAWD